MLLQTVDGDPVLSIGTDNIDLLDDLSANDLARRIARRLEEDLQYPGQIQVTVIRELRVTDYAR